MAIVPVLGLALGLIVSKAHPNFKKLFKTYDKLNSVVNENLHGIRVVKSFVREDEEEKKFGAVSDKIYSLSKKAEGIIAFNAPVMQFSSYLCMILIAWFGANLIIKTNAVDMTTGELFSLINYTMQILMNLMSLSMIFVMLTMSRASAESFRRRRTGFCCTAVIRN